MTLLSKLISNLQFILDKPSLRIGNSICEELNEVFFISYCKDTKCNECVFASKHTSIQLASDIQNVKNYSNS